MAERVQDPVCRMTLDKAKAAASVQYKGRTYYFCAPGCKVKFEKAPEQYVYAGGSAKSDNCH